MRKSQASLEYILLLGGVILIVVLVGILMRSQIFTPTMSKTKTQTNQYQCIIAPAVTELKNGDFEDWNGTTLSDWSSNATEQTNDSADGNYAIKINSGGYVQQALNFSLAGHYMFFISTKSSDGNEAKVNVTLQFTNSSGGTHIHRWIETNSEQKWKTKAFFYLIPENNANLTVKIENGEGIPLVDSVKITTCE